MKNFKRSIAAALLVVAIMCVCVLSASAYGTIPVSEKQRASESDYTFAFVGDTQKMNHDNPSKMGEMYDWIVSHKTDKNIQFVFGLGDITDASLEREYTFAAEQFQKLDAANIPYSVVRGNHDSVSTYDTYITYDQFGGKTPVSGTLDGTMKNTWQKMTVCGINYLFLNIDYGVDQDMVDTINAFLTANSEYRVIVTLHVFLGTSYGGVPTQREDSSSSMTRWGMHFTSVELWDNIFKLHDNIQMVVCGHAPTPYIEYRSDLGVNGNLVNEFLIDPQSEDANQGGLGLVALFHFSDGGNTVEVEYFSVANNAYFDAMSQYKVNLETGELTRYTAFEEPTEYQVNDVLFSEDFSADRTNSYIKLNQKNHVDAEDNPVFTETVEDGKYKINLNSVSTQKAYRMNMYHIPDNVTSFRVSMDVRINEVLATGVSHNVGLVLSDNVIAGNKSSAFQFIWLRQGYSSGVRLYGADDTNPSSMAQSNSVEGICVEGANYNVTADVDRIAKTVTFTITNTDTNAYYSSSCAYYEEGNVGPYVGIAANAIDAEFDQFTVTATAVDNSLITPVVNKTYEKGELLFLEDFSTDNWANYEKLYGATNSSKSEQVLGNMRVNTETGKLEIRDSSASGGTGGYSTQTIARIPMYEVPDSVDSFSVVFNATYFAGSGTSSPLGFFVADDGSSTYQHLHLQMFWLRASTATSGITFYKDSSTTTSVAAVQQNCSSISLVQANANLRVTTYIDRTAHKGYYLIENLTNGAFLGGAYIYADAETTGVDAMMARVGLINAGLDVDIDSIAVYCGDITDGDMTEENFGASGTKTWSGASGTLRTEFTNAYPTVDEPRVLGTNLILNQSLAFKYTAHIDDEHAGQTVMAKFSLENKTETLELAGVDVGGGNYEFTFEGIGPHQIGKLITADLYCDGVLFDRYITTIKDYLKALISDTGMAGNTKELAAAVLEYGAAAQIYKNEDTSKLVNADYDTNYTPATVVADPAPYVNNKIDMSSGVKISSMGVRFDSQNRLFYKLTIPGGSGVVTMTVNGAPVAIVNGTAVSEGLYATEYDSVVTANLYVDGNLVQTLEYSVANYVASQQTKTTDMANLAKAMYTYGSLAAAY